jgi:hypothetical protein
MVTLSVFALTASLAFAADQWVVIKDKNGVCKVIEAKGKTDKTIAGPFKTKDEAKKAKEEKCGKEKEKTKK